MRNDLADLTIVVDRSGSMSSIQDEAEAGVNTFITEQAKAPGEAVLTLVEFDDKYEFVHKAVPIKGVPPYRLVPRGMTALLDAVGRSIAETGDRLAKMPEDQRPGLVAFVIVTDGMENSSQEFTRQKVREMITRQREQYNWQFTFLGAGDSAWQADRLGISAKDAASYSPKNVARAYSAASSKMSRSREQLTAGLSPETDFSDEEREAMSK
jgi:uncharacterized protein YegL